MPPCPLRRGSGFVQSPPDSFRSENALAAALPRFRERYPKLTVDLRLTDGLVDIVEEGIDVAIRVGDLVDSRLIIARQSG
ncbi:DNA-binding transcriptional LysR family regulator [Bradyrhizobium sp. USDA 3240]